MGATDEAIIFKYVQTLRAIAVKAMEEGLLLAGSRFLLSDETTDKDGYLRINTI